MEGEKGRDEEGEGVERRGETKRVREWREGGR